MPPCPVPGSPSSMRHNRSPTTGSSEQSSGNAGGSSGNWRACSARRSHSPYGRRGPRSSGPTFAPPALWVTSPVARSNAEAVGSEAGQHLEGVGVGLGPYEGSPADRGADIHGGRHPGVLPAGSRGKLRFTAHPSRLRSTQTAPPAPARRDRHRGHPTRKSDFAKGGESTAPPSPTPRHQGWDNELTPKPSGFRLPSTVLFGKDTGSTWRNAFNRPRVPASWRTVP